MKAFLTLAATLAALSVNAQGPARTVATITELLNEVNPAASAQGSTVSYFVTGYTNANSFAKAREFFASTTPPASTNLAHNFRSIKNPSYYWRSADLAASDQDPRWFGAALDGSRDDTAAIQAAIDYSPVHNRTLYLPANVTAKITAPLRFETGTSGASDYMAINVRGNNSTIISYTPSNILQLNARSIFYGKIQDLVFTYDQTYTNLTTHNVISLKGDPTGLTYYNIYNVSFHNLTFLRGYYAIKQEEWCSPWGNDYRRWFVSQEMTGGAVDFAPASNFGNVNNVFESIYARADVMAGPVFKIKNQNLLAMKDIEINILSNKVAMLLTASSSVNIQNWRMEVGALNVSYDGLFQLANVTGLIWDNLQIQSFNLDAPAGTWNYIIRDVGTGPAVNTSSLQFNNLYLKNIVKTNTGSYLAMFYSPYQRYALKTWDQDGTVTNNVYVSYPFGAPATNVQAQVSHRSITDLPTLPGEFAFDTNNWPYISTGIGSTTNWLRLGNSDVFGPASSTDNAVVRFDGTTGKRIQNSTVIVDDSGNMTVPGTVFDLGSGSGNPIVSVKGAAGGVRSMRFYSGASGLRWNVGANSTAESGSNAGSDYEWNAYSDASGFLVTPLSIRRSDGVIRTYGAIDFGSLAVADAPSISYNTGSPEGSITANPGSIRLDKNGNAWLKQTGTGNTGWRQMGMTTVANGSTVITNIAQGTGIQITAASGAATIGMSNTAVTPGTYNYATITVDQQGRLTAASSGSVTPYTSFWPDLTNAVRAGANISISNDTATSKMYISAVSPTASTNGTPVSVNGSSALALANFLDATGIKFNVSGSNITALLNDRDWGDITSAASGTTLFLDNYILTTNHFSAPLYNWILTLGTTYGFSTGLTNSAGTVTVNFEAGSGILFATNGTRLTISSTNTPTIFSVNGGAAMSSINFQDNSAITFSQVGSNVTASINVANDGIANLLLVTDTETTDTNTDTTWRDVTPAARSGMSATIGAGVMNSGALIKIEAIGELITAGGSDWQPDFKIVFDGPTGTDYEVVYSTSEPGTAGGQDGVTWKIECFLTIRASGNPATLIQRSQWACSDGIGNNEPTYNDAGWIVAVPGRPANSLNTTADNTIKLYYRANNNNVTSMKVSSLVVWKL